MATIDEVQAQVRSRYAAAAVAAAGGQDCGCGDTGCCGNGTPAAALVQTEAFGPGLYAAAEQGELPAEALLASLGCGNPVALADLHPGETVLDLGSGGGIDVLLSARRVGPDGFAYGVDMTDEMLDLARANAAKAGAANVELLKGTIEELPLPDASVDVVISNCVINLSADKPRVLAEMFRVLRPGGRVGVSDVVAENHLTADDRAARGSFSGCIAGALSQQEYLDGLVGAGFVDASVTFTHEAEPQMHAAIVRATRPAGDHPAASSCCSAGEQAVCCDSSAKTDCCATGTGTGAPASCGCR